MIIEKAIPKELKSLRDGINLCHSFGVSRQAHPSIIISSLRDFLRVLNTYSIDSCQQMHYIYFLKNQIRGTGIISSPRSLRLRIQRLESPRIECFCQLLIKYALRRMKPVVRLCRGVGTPATAKKLPLVEKFYCGFRRQWLFKIESSIPSRT